MATVRLDLLPSDHPLRSRPLAEIRASYRWERSKSGPRPVLPSFAIARQTFNSLGGAWVAGYEWYCEVSE